MEASEVVAEAVTSAAVPTWIMWVAASLWAVTLGFFWRMVRNRDSFEKKVAQGFQSIDTQLALMDKNHALMAQRIEWVKLVNDNLEGINKKIDKNTADLNFYFQRVRNIEAASAVIEKSMRAKTHYLLNSLTKVQAAIFSIDKEAGRIDFGDWPD